jgi:CDP-glucose 4,6-dehydratase
VGLGYRAVEGLVTRGVNVRAGGMDDLFAGAFKGRRVFVTGHTGFKGSWLTEWLLGLGAQVTGYALAPPTDPNLFDELGLGARIRSVVADVRDLDRLRAEMAHSRPEYVFHLAAQPIVRLSYDRPVETYSTNVMGTVNLLEAVRDVDTVRVVVNVTSDKCYENRETGQSYREDDPMGGFDPYSSSKGCSELVTAAYRRSFFGEGSGVALSSARAGNVVGGGDWALDRIVPDCIRALTKAEPVIVRNPGAVRPWQHVLEPLSGYLLLASRMMEGGHDLDGGWNFGPLEQGSVAVRDVVEIVLAAWGSGAWESPAGTGARVHEASLLALDIAKARQHLCWQPLYDVERTLRVTATWYAARHEGGDVAALTRADIDAYVTAGRSAGAAWSRADR